MVWQLIPQHGSRCSEGSVSLRTFLYGFLVSSKVNRTRIGTFSLVYSYGSDRLDTVPLSTSNVRNRILYGDLKRTGNQGSWNKTGVIWSLSRVRVTRLAALTVSGLLEREERYSITIICIAVVKSRNYKRLD